MLRFRKSFRKNARLKLGSANEIEKLGNVMANPHGNGIDRAGDEKAGPPPLLPVLHPVVLLTSRY
jgi:hypothetical protein